ncbi:MAG: type II toxin-antitoxin system RelE/ParE family toxin [Mariniphaga sp.]|nr:type II toxin-antitoxin system RelE/ParE family toxin [Mariniphaga sp.]
MVKRKIVWSPRSKHDLYKILDFYYKRNGTKTYSRRLNLAFRKSVRLLEKNSDIGVKTDIINVRNLIEGDFSIFYEIKSGIIEISAIWDNRQNPDEIDLF